MIRLAVLGSTRGTNLAALQKEFNAIQIVISNKEHSGILDVARSLAIPAVYVSPQGLDREAYDAKVSDLLLEANVDLIVLLGYMRILSNTFVAQWRSKIINVHPSLLPAHAGLMDLQVHRAVLAADEKETGCTVHYVTENVDEGPIIVQKRCEVLPADTAESLKVRVQKLEVNALIEAIQILNNKNIARV